MGLGATLPNHIPACRSEFNHYEIDGFEELHDKDYEVYKKMDGSLALLFHYNDLPIFCTCASFCSDQALKAEEIYDFKYKDVEVRRTGGQTDRRTGPRIESG